MKLWQKETAKFGADIERVQVWDALSSMFLDTSFDEEQKRRLAGIIADSPFSKEELEHILLCEVSPFCGTNLFSLAGEWALFSPDQLIPECLKRQRANPFLPGSRASSIAYSLAFALFPDACSLLKTAGDLRNRRKSHQEN